MGFNDGLCNRQAKPSSIRVRMRSCRICAIEAVKQPWQHKGINILPCVLHRDLGGRTPLDNVDVHVSLVWRMAEGI